jgi:selenide,water dikinase
VCYPECEDMQVLRDILAGGLSKIEEAGALLVGGHTIDDQEPKYGLSVTGMVHPDRVISNAGAKPGDVLILTKPIGNGIIATAIKAEMASQEASDEAARWMTTLNREASEVMQEIGVHAATDITGFGLVGHLQEMAAASETGMELWSDNVPVMTGVLDYAAIGLVPAGAYSNREYLAGKVVYEQEIDAALNDVLFCPETAGGLLIAVEESRADAVQQALRSRQVPAAVVGVIRMEKAGQPGTIYVRRK